VLKYERVARTCQRRRKDNAAIICGPLRIPVRLNIQPRSGNLRVGLVFDRAAEERYRGKPHAATILFHARARASYHSRGTRLGLLSIMIDTYIRDDSAEIRAADSRVYALATARSL